MKVIRTLILVMILWLPSKMGMAQNDCLQSFTKAQRAYDDGRLKEVERILNTCMRSFTPEEKVRAYRLITLANIFQDHLDEADKSYARLLNADPDYEPKKNDPIELQYLHTSFRTWPTASFGLVGGPNLTVPSITKYHSVDNSDLPNGDYAEQMSFQFGAAGEFYLSKKFSISPQVLLTTNKLKFEDNLFDFSTLSYTETQQWVEIPVSIKRYFDWKKTNVIPFISLGASASFLQKSSAEAIRDVADGKDATGPNVNTIDLRNKINYSAIGTIGIKKHFRHIHAFVSVSFKRDIFNQVDEAKRYNIPELTYKYGYVDNDYTTSYFIASVGISYALYQHRRIKPRIPDLEKRAKEPLAKKKKK